MPQVFHFSVGRSGGNARRGSWRWLVGLLVVMVGACAQSGSRNLPSGDGGLWDVASGDGTLTGDGGSTGDGALAGDGAIVSSCGNGTLDPGEDCEGDDLGGQNCLTLDNGYIGGTLTCTAGCSFDTSGCILPGCGNGVIDAGEECDDGNTTSGDGCSASCVQEYCGDGILQSGLGEDCDDGNQSDTDDCPSTCLPARCGDGFIWSGHEQCDDGNTTSGDGCSASCVREYCGDGIVQSGLGEECDGDPDRACDPGCGTQGRQSCSASGCVWGRCVPPTESCNAVDDDCDGVIDTTACMNHLYRFYNPTTGDHMFKANDPNPDPGYQLENHGFYLYATEVPGTHVLYQRYQSTTQDHMTTTNPTEGDSSGYVGAEILGYISLQGSNTWHAAGLVPSQYCRWYSPGAHDHLSLPAGQTPTGYQLDFCGNWWWGAY